MEKEPQSSRSIERWAHFRFSVIGPLLAAPPARGQLHDQLKDLAAKKWRHPISGQWVELGLSTIERWYYKPSAPKPARSRCSNARSAPIRESIRLSPPAWLNF